MPSPFGIELQREWSAWKPPPAVVALPPAACSNICSPACPRRARQRSTGRNDAGQTAGRAGSPICCSRPKRTITPKLLDRALLWLHEQEIIRLNKGLAVFRPAMTIRLEPDWKKKFTPPDFAPLKLHYDEQVVQIHVMAEYVQRGLRPWLKRCT
jgi:hypothetical protein